MVHELIAKMLRRGIIHVIVIVTGSKTTMRAGTDSGPEKGVITKGVFSPEKSLESLKSLDSLESLENGRNLLSFPQSGGSLETLESLNSLESLENGLF